MKLVIGLGNPGEKYANSRHNVGHVVIDKLLKTQKLKNSKQVKIFKSQNFMNDSGNFVRELTIRYPLSDNDLYVIHDDLDLPLGTWKIQFAKGPKDHGGINDIEQKLSTDNFWRVRVGVDNRKPESLDYARDKTSRGGAYVLQDFSEDEKKILEEVINKICKKLARL